GRAQRAVARVVASLLIFLPPARIRWSAMRRATHRRSRRTARLLRAHVRWRLRPARPNRRPTSAPAPDACKRLGPGVLRGAHRRETDRPWHLAAHVITAMVPAYRAPRK